MHEHLLEQAVTLARIDARRPKQANLRRADFGGLLCCVSSANHRVQERYPDEFQNLAPSDEKNFFLACLWAWKELVESMRLVRSDGGLRIPGRERRLRQGPVDLAGLDIDDADGTSSQ